MCEAFIESIGEKKQHFIVNGGTHVRSMKL